MRTSGAGRSIESTRHVLMFRVRRHALARFAAAAPDTGRQRNTAAQALERFTKRVRDHPHAAEAASLFARLVAVVAAKLGQVHLGERKDIVMLLRAPLHAARRVDVEKLEPRHALPLSREIPEQHFLQMLAVEIHSVEHAVALQDVEKLLATNCDTPAAAMHDRKTERERKILD